MSSETLPTRDSTFMTRRIPPAAWLLAAAAVATLAFGLMSRGLIGRYLVLPAEHMIPVAELATPFLVAAGVVAGAERWPNGRRLLLVGAVLHSLHGLLALGWDTWFWWSATSGPGIVSATDELIVFGGSLVMWLVGTAAMLTLALGLWSTRAGGARTGWRILAGVVVAVLALIAAAGALWSPLTRPGQLAVPVQAVTALVPVAITCLGIAAITILPARHRLPEILIAAGVAISVAAMAWSQWFMNATRIENVPAEWVDLAFLLPRGVVVAGFLVVAAGFASARLFPVRERTTP